jgi:23S rRNA (cytidine1920-2'-O)/16S rRNA (cytidine1409-2'-O)-methyltransferase
VTSQRLDEALVMRGLSQSRSRARDAILRGTVLVNGVAARKPSQGVFKTDILTVEDPAKRYVSRSALKLLHGLDHFNIAVAGRYALDIGASTGGFTQVLLKRGVAHVTAIDVGHGQMAPEIAENPRVTSFENLNARDLSREEVSEAIDFIVTDVSFISLKLALLPALSLVATGAELVALIKPQFEVGREFVGRGGMVTDTAQHQRVCEEITSFLEEQGWDVQGVVASPVDGGDGNAEFLVAARKR